jgi:chromosome segregation ATPase
MKQTRILIIFILWSAVPTNNWGYTFHDPIHTVLNIGEQVIGQVRQQAQHLESIAKYTTMIQKQVQQINQMTTMINQNVDQLRRFGNPDTYINMLGLDQLLSEVDKIEAGVDKTVGEFQKTANGVIALKNTAQGLYEDFSELPDKFGQRVRYETDRFKKFGAVQDMYDDYNKQLTNLNRSLDGLEGEAKATVQQINSAGSLVETEKFKAKMEAIQGTIETHMQKAQLAALKVLIQGEANRNDQARQQEVQRQRQAQEVAEDNQRLRSFGVNALGPSNAN